MDLEEYKRFRNAHVGFARDVGIVITHLTEGLCEGEIRLEARHLNPLGKVHGGAIFTLMDTVAGVAGATYGYYITTSGGNVDYLRPAGGAVLRARATAVKAGKALMVFDVEALDEEDVLVAKGSFTLFRFQKKIEI